MSLFTFQAIYDPKVGSVLANGVRVNGQPLKVTAPDARTVVVTLPGAFGPGIAILDNVHIQPKHKLQAALAGGHVRPGPGRGHAAGGPRRASVRSSFAATSPVSGMVFDRNPRYWKKDAAGIQLPYADQVVLEVVPDQNAELLRLQSGQIDMLQQAIRPEDVATLRPLIDAGPRARARAGRRHRSRPVVLQPALVTTGRRIRGATGSRARSSARRFRTRWIARPRPTPCSSAPACRSGGRSPQATRSGSRPTCPRYGFSVDRAREILAGIGLTNRDGDEWLEDARNTEARFTLLTYRGNSSLERGAAFLRDVLRPVGIAVDVVALEQGALVQRMLKGEFESIMFFVSTTNLDPSMNPDFWLSSGSAHIWNIGQSKPATDWEKEIDDLMGEITAQVDHNERRRLFDQVQKIFAEHLPVIYFVAPRLHMGVSSRVGGLEPAILRPQLLWNVDRITVQPTPR